MTNLDRILHLVGAAAGGVLVVGATGGAAIPVWLMVTAAVVQVATGMTSNPAIKLPSMTTPKPDARGQVADPENPKP